MQELPTLIEARLRERIADADVSASGEGNRVHVRVTSPMFAGLNRVRRQQLVYGAIDDLIRAGAVHAVTMETRTPDET